MKNFRYLFIISFVIASSCFLLKDKSLNKVEATTSSGVVSFSNEVNAPSDLSRDSYTLKGSYIYNKQATESNVKTRVEYYSPYFENGLLAYSIQNTSIGTIKKNQVIRYSYNVPNFKQYIDKSIKVKLGLYSDDKKTYLDYVSYSLYPKANIALDPDLYKDYPYVFNNISQRDGTSLKETFLFNNFISYLDIDRYYILDLSKLTFQYSAPFAFSYEEAYLSFKGGKSLFPHLEVNQDNDPYVKIHLSSRDYIVSLFFNNDFYVDKESLEIYSKKENNTEPTNHLYLPKNKLKEMSEVPVILTVKNIGLNNTSFSYEMEFNAERNLFGSCLDSDYCIVGGILD